MRRLTTEEFIAKADIVHSGKYDYPNTVYTTARGLVEILCPQHGSFTQKAHTHTNGAGCNACGVDKNKAKLRDTTESFVTKAIKVHGNRYSYSRVVYTKSVDSIIITCTDHGDFKQTPNVHLSGCGCPSCGKLVQITKRAKSQLDFIKDASSLHNNKYKYDKAVYKNSFTPLIITCDIHGDFYQKPSDHMAGCGCNQCGIDDNTERNTKSIDVFIEQANTVHSNKYNYLDSVYIRGASKLDVICSIHGKFSQTPENHLQGAGCPKCSNRESNKETEIFDYTTSLGFSPISGDRSIIKPLELDIVLPDKNIAIEYNGIRWHSEAFGRGKHYHKNKTDLCTQAGYRLIHIWEDDYLKDPDKELNFLKHTLGLNEQDKVYARKTTIKEIPKNIGRDFLELHHIQGSGNGSVYLGTYYQEELVSVTSFLFKDKKTSAELTRHVNSKTVVGGLGKVTKYFSKLYKIDITSFCDLARFDGKSYRLAGFEEVNIIPPDYKYVVGAERQHKFGWRKSSIKVKRPDVYDESLTEKQMMELAEIPRIWDCGKIKFIYKYKN